MQSRITGVDDSFPQLEIPMLQPKIPMDKSGAFFTRETKRGCQLDIVKHCRMRCGLKHQSFGEFRMQNCLFDYKEKVRALGEQEKQRRIYRSVEKSELARSIKVTVGLTTALAG